MELVKMVITFMVALWALTLPGSAGALSWTLGPETVSPHPPGVTLQFPDSAFAMLPSRNSTPDGVRLPAV
jgi:hypothetical protein